MTVKQEQSGRLSFLGISRIGESHIKHGLQNQDAIAYNSLGESFFIAVSDGLGSCKRSQIGSQIAVSLCNEIFLKVMDARMEFSSDVIVNELMALWVKSIPEEEAGEYSATLKAAFVKEGIIIALSIGDGLLFVKTGEETFSLEGKAVDFVNETECLSKNIKQSAIKIIKIEGGEKLSVFLCTDGVSSGISDGHERALFEEIASLVNHRELQDQLTAMLTEISKVNADDKTIGIVTYA
jgi:serine/threonine protein phosphatase PrpC